jgi:hypothetical protein
MLRVVGLILVVFVAATTLVIGCSSLNSLVGESNRGGAQGPDSTGTIDGKLTLPGGEHIGVGSYTLANATNSYTGSINITATNVLSFTIGSIAAGTGYTLSLSATTDDGAFTCAATAGPITVVNRTTTTVGINLQCTSNQGRDSGSLVVYASASNCPVWNTIVANPTNITPPSGSNVDDAGTAGSTSISPGSTSVPADIGVNQSLVLVGSATAPDPGQISFLWATTGGSLSSAQGTIDPNSNDAGTTNETTFTCPPTPGQITVTMVVSDGPLPEGGGCDVLFTTGTVTINCQAAAPTCAFGTGCGDGGQICNMAGSCVPALFSAVVLSSLDGGPIGNVTTALPISIQTYDLTGTPVGAPMPLPTALNGAQQPVAIMGNDITEGDLTTSTNGAYLSMTGWDTTPGSAAVGQPVVARIDSTGHVDTSTVVTGAFQTQSPFSYRSAVSNDGNEFWVSGVAFGDQQGNAGGIWYVPFGATAGTQIVSLPDSNINPNMDIFARWLRIFNGQLYGGSDQVPPYMFSVGTGLPTTGPMTPSSLPLAATTASPSPYGFLLFNLNGSSGPDTMYIADDGVNPAGIRDNGGAGSVDTGTAGLSKWTFSAASGWTQVWNITSGIGPADAGLLSGEPLGYRGLTGFATGTTVTLMATTANVQGLQDSLALVMVDNGTATPPTPHVVVTSPVGQVFRGVALSPQ